jgi:hypothetical protein
VQLQARYRQSAGARLNGADQLTVQLIRPATMPAIERTLSPAVISIVWPPLPSVVTPQRFPEVAAAVARLFAAAATELAAIKAQKRL